MPRLTFSDSLLDFTGGARSALLAANSVTAAFREIGDRFPDLARAAFRDGRPSRSVIVFVDGVQVRAEHDAPLGDRSEISIVSIAFGG